MYIPPRFDGAIPHAAVRSGSRCLYPRLDHVQSVHRWHPRGTACQSTRYNLKHGLGNLAASCRILWNKKIFRDGVLRKKMDETEIHRRFIRDVCGTVASEMFTEPWCKLLVMNAHPRLFPKTRQGILPRMEAVFKLDCTQPFNNNGLVYCILGKRGKCIADDFV